MVSNIQHNEEDNKWYMVDTYLGDKYIELTDEILTNLNLCLILKRLKNILEKIFMNKMKVIGGM